MEVLLAQLHRNFAARSGRKRRFRDGDQAAILIGQLAITDEIEPESALRHVQRINPFKGLDAVAYSFIWMRPAR